MDITDEHVITTASTATGKTGIIEEEPTQIETLTELKQFSSANDDLTKESNVDEMKVEEEDLVDMNEKDDFPSSTKDIIAVESSIELAKSEAMEVGIEMEESKGTEGDDIKQTESDVTSTALHTDLDESVLECEVENDQNDSVKKTTDISEKPAGELETEESTMAATSNVSEALQKNVGIPDEVKSAVSEAETEVNKSLDISKESDAHIESNIKTKEPQENDAIERPLNSSNETEKPLTAENPNVIEIDDEPQVPTKYNENDANEKPLISLNETEKTSETAENSNVIDIDEEPQVLTKNNEKDANEKPLNSSNETEKTSETAENTNVIEIDDEPQVLTKDYENENAIEKPLNSSNETAKPLTGENPNAIEINDETKALAKNDEKVSEQPIEKKVENDPNSDDDVQFEKPNIMVIEIDDDDDDDDDQHGSATINTVKNDSTCKENVESAKLQENPTEKLDAMDVDVATTAEKLATEDVEMNETAATVDKNEKLAQDTDTNTLLIETTKAPSPTLENSEKLSTDDDTSGEVYYNKECVNYECARKHKQFFRAPLFALSYYKIAKKKFKPQFICAECYDQALEMYEEFSSLLAAKQPLLLKDIVGGRQEFVEIIDSSDEEDEDDKTDKAKDNKYFSKDDIKLIEDELENSIRKVLGRVEIQNQLTWSKTILASRAKALEAETNYIDAELRSLQKKADHMHVTLYQCPKIKVRQLQPLDLNTGRPFATADVDVALPPIGEIQRPSIKINEIYYAVKNKAIASWVPCRVVEQVEGLLIMKNITHYKIRFLKSQYQPFKTVSVKHLAYYEPPSVRLPIGSRVIAYFDATSLSRGKEKMMIQSAFYPGIIAEPLKPNNKYRYLIFYDDGYTQYVHHKDVRLVCNVSDNVWEDVHPGSRDFIQKYLTQYSINRPMVQTQKGQSMTTESNGKWIYARVVDIDCSLIQMQFEGPKSHTEWIYRGSMRLGPVFKEHQKTMQKTTMPISRLPRRTEPFIRYTEDEEATTTQQRQLQQQQNEPRAVAKKSVSRQESQNNTSQQFTPVPPVVRHLNNSTIYLEDENKPKGKVVYYTAKRNLPPKTYKPHTCSPACLYKITHNLSAYSPLSKPLLSGWERLIIRQKIKKVVTYRGPCGKISRNMRELRNYLRATNNVLNVENFDFSPETNCLAEYVIESAIVQKRDISNGQEKMAIPLVNYYDNTMPPECKYSAQRIPTEGVELIVDEEFLVGCDCEDDCSDKTKCSCWQLTYAGAKYGNPNTPIEEIGYQYKRLYEHVPTGIYECNSRCKCKSNCLNRVVQHSLEMKLQVFKTSNRGWGLRCINDVPRGSFMCVYAGHLLTEAKANEGGLDAGDEYFAELDYIEVAEQIKEGYESDIGSPEPEEEDDLYDHEDHDDEFTPSKPHNTRSKAKLQKSTRGSSSAQGIDEDSQERQMINFNPNAIMDENSMRESSIRKLFGKDEACYVMDAKVTGNLGRYFNHSCSPNLFVQNVFVDTHDLRFPWVAFFALTHIRAGTELTWNYNYEVGVVPGKVLYCQCGAPNCRLRLL